MSGLGEGATGAGAGAACGRTRRSAVLGLAAVAALAGILGAIAGDLNTRYYRHHQPFFDSLSYHTTLHRVMSTARHEGLAAAVHRACLSTNTVCLPYLVGVGLGKWIEPTRKIGVAIQAIELLALDGSLYVYFLCVRRLAAAAAAASVLPWLAMACLFYANGGLSDFRMDLSLMLLYGVSCVWYLIARRYRKGWAYAVCGLASAAASLFRATAPIYLAAALGPLIAVDVMRSRDRGRMLGHLGVGAVVAAAGCGWFYAANWEYLYYYYAVWNTDARAGLAWPDALRHLEFAARHIGPAAAGCLAALFVAGRRRPPADESSAPAWEAGPLWIGLAPLLLLIGMGAGFNPFVSMPAAFGLLWAAVLPVAARLAPPFQLRFILWTLIAVACVVAAAAKGYRRHRPTAIDSMAVHREVLQRIVDDASSQGWRHVRYGVAFVGEISAESLQNVLLFDIAEAETRVARTIWRGVQLMPDATFFRPAEANWREVPGADDGGRRATLVAAAGERVDYLIVPEPESAAALRARYRHVVVNRHCVELRRMLLAEGVWTPISPCLQNSPDERFRIYRNARTLEHRGAR